MAYLKSLSLGILAILFLLIPLQSRSEWQIHSPTSEYNSSVDRIKCESCHILTPLEGFLLLNDPINDSCLSAGCHQDTLSGSYDHPSLSSIDFNTISIPKAFWLDDHLDITGNPDPRLNCATCHDPHPENAEYKPYLLRYNSVGTFFCQECHTEENTPGYDLVLSTHRQEVFSAHALPHTVAHTAHPDEGTEPMDRTSTDCSTQCHPQTDRHSGFCLTGLEKTCKGHYIGIDYDEKAEKSSRLVPRTALNPLVSLHEGKVGCLSCHSIYSKNKNLLTIANDGSALCLTCHLK